MHGILFWEEILEVRSPNADDPPQDVSASWIFFMPPKHLLTFLSASAALLLVFRVQLSKLGSFADRIHIKNHGQLEFYRLDCTEQGS